MTVLCAIPLQIQVHRIRVTVKCLATGGPVHSAVLRLADFWGEAPEEIAEVLGLPISRVEELLVDLDEGGEEIEREFVLWVDHARGRVLPYSALSGAAVKPERKDGPFTLYADPPTPAQLAGMGLDAGLSWDLGLEGHVEVLDVLDLVPDIRDNSLPHVLRLPDTQLLIADPASPPAPGEQPPYKLFVLQHGVPDPQLTGWANNNFAKDLQKLIERGDPNLSEGHKRPTKHLADLTSQGHWDTLEPHPALLRKQVAEATEAATERLVLSAPDLRHLPTWLLDALKETHDRDVQVVLSPAKPELIPKRTGLKFTIGVPAERPRALTMLADDSHAVVHSDPAAVLDRDALPTRQHLFVGHESTAIGRLLERLGLKRLRPAAPPRQLPPQTIAAMLKRSLDGLQDELPDNLEASIQSEDEQFALATLHRQRGPENPTRAARRAAAGIAWERVLATRLRNLAARYDTLHVLAERWLPPNARIDLDLIVADERKGLAWIIDAKNANPNDDQLAKMRDQIRLLKKEPKITDGHPIIGVIVHRKDQLDPPVQATEHHNILRCTLQRLPDLLLAKRLPGSA
jgi:hypothetical protein